LYNSLYASVARATHLAQVSATREVGISLQFPLSSGKHVAVGLSSTFKNWLPLNFNCMWKNMSVRLIHACCCWSGWI